MCLKEELAWSTDKWPWAINNMILFKTVIYTPQETKE